jgi:hypothetical protein
MDGLQLSLDFSAAAEAAAERMAAARGELWRLAESISEGERLGKLAEAAARMGAGPRLTAALLAVARSAGSDSRAVITLSHRQLAGELACSERTARRVADDGKRCGLLRTLPAIDEQGFCHGPNSYSIDWPEVLSACHPSRADKIGHPLAKNGQGVAKNGHPPRRDFAPIPRARAGAVLASFLLSEEKNSGPVPVPEPVRQKLQEEPADLVDARQRAIEPMPLGRRLADGVFRPLTPAKLADPLAMIEWTRRQLSADLPVVDATEADLLLVLACARYATHPPIGKPIRSPVGWFTWAARKRDAGLVRAELRWAVEILDRLREQWGEDLLRGEWPVANETVGAVP